MATVDKGGTVTLQELLVTSLAHTDAVAKLLIEKGVITQDELVIRFLVATPEKQIPIINKEVVK